MSNTAIRDRLVKDLPRNEDHRYAYDEEFLNTYISAQIRALREAREMTQTDLAKAVKTGQSKISEMESDYGSWSLRTLRKLARAFGLRLFVTFESWGELIPKVEGFSLDSLVKPTIENDDVFVPRVGRDTSLAARALVCGTATATPGPVFAAATTDAPEIAPHTSVSSMKFPFQPQNRSLLYRRVPPLDPNRKEPRGEFAWQKMTLGSTQKQKTWDS